MNGLVAGVFSNQASAAQAPMQMALRYGFVLSAVLMALGLRLLIDPWLGPVQPFVTFYMVVIWVAWWGGWRLATFATVLGLLAGLGFVVPRGNLLLGISFPNLVQSIVYCGLSGMIISLMHHARRMQFQAQAHAETLRQREEDYRITFEMAALGNALLDPVTQQFLRVNEAFCHLTGYSREELLPKHFVDITPSVERDPVMRQLQALATGTARIYQGEHQFCRKNGHVIWGRMSAAKIRGCQDRSWRLLVSVEDVTARKQAEDILRQTEQKLSYHFANSPLVVIEWDQHSRVIRWTGAAESVFGWKAEEVLGKHVTEWPIVYEADREKVSQLFGQLECGARRRMNSVNRNNRKDGSLAYCEWYNSAFCNEAGQVVSILSLGLDVTARKQAEERLLRAKEEWERTFNSVPDMIAILDKEHRMIRVNRAMAQRLQKTPEQCAGQMCYQCIHGTDHPPENCPHTLTLKDHRYHAGEFREERLGADFLITTTPLFDERGEFVGAVHVARDITERKRAEAALRISEERLRLAAEVANFGTYDADLATGDLYWSPQLKVIFGLPESEPPPHLEELQKRFHPEDRPWVSEMIARALDPKGPGNFAAEHRIVRPDGTVRWVLAKGRVFFSGEGTARRPYRSLGTAVDITERKQAEQAMRLAKDQLARANESLETKVAERTASLQASMQSMEEMLYALAHDLRAPNRAMNGFANILLEDYQGKLDAQGQDLLRRIAEASKKSDQLIKGLLDYGRVAQEDLPLEVVNLSIPVHQALSRLVDEIHARHAVVHLAQQNWPEVLTNARVLRRVLNELISNSLKFVPPGVRPEIGLSVERHNGQVLLSLQDNGIGVAPEHWDRIFKPFQRLHHEHEYAGTGIGLAIVHRALERLGSEVSVKSTPGHGSRFTMTLKAA